MPDHRYWKLAGLRPHGGGALELSSARLYGAAGIMDGAATKTVSVAPTTGSLGGVFDGEDVSTFALWTREQRYNPGFALQWDFGAPVTPTAVRFGSGPTDGTSPLEATVLWSDDGYSWTVHTFSNNIKQLPPSTLAPAPTSDSGQPFFDTDQTLKPRVRVGDHQLRILPATTLGATYARQFPGTYPFSDIENGGGGYVYGTVKEKNTPANTPLRRRVILVDERKISVVRETWSDAITGNYAFVGIRTDRTYTVVAYDYLRNYRAVVADNLTPELMA